MVFVNKIEKSAQNTTPLLAIVFRSRRPTADGFIFMAVGGDVCQLVIPNGNSPRLFGVEHATPGVANPGIDIPH